MTGCRRNPNGHDEPRLVDDALSMLGDVLSSGHPTPFDAPPSAEEMAGVMVDMLCRYASQELTTGQRAAALAVVRVLPAGDATIERFVASCDGQPELTGFAQALRQQLAAPSGVLHQEDE